MIKIIKNLLVSLFIVISIYFMITDTKDVMEAVHKAVMLWATRVFPVLFPFYIITSLAVKFGVAHFFGELIKPITSLLFKTSSISGFIFFMSLISGNPSSAILISQLYDDRSITKTEAQHLLNFCVFANPIFIIGAIGYSYFNNSSIGYIILMAHILGNVFIGFLLRFNIKSRGNEPFSLKMAYQKMVKHKEKHLGSYGETVTVILQNGINTMFLICSFMIFYNLIVVMFDSSQFIYYSYHYLSGFYQLFNIEYMTYHAFFTGFFEMVIGVDFVVKGHFPLRVAVTFITMIISFGGLSIHSQIQSILLKVKLRYFPFFLSRLAQMVFSGVIAYTIFPLFYREKTSSTIFLYPPKLEERNIILLSLVITILTLLTILVIRHNKLKANQVSQYKIK